MMGKRFVFRAPPAQDEGLLTVDPHSDQAAVLVVVEVTRGSDAGPHEPAVGQERSESRQEEGPWGGRSEF